MNKYPSLRTLAAARLRRASLELQELEELELIEHSKYTRRQESRHNGKKQLIHLKIRLS